MDQTQPETEQELGQELQYLRMRTQAKRESAQARSRQAHLRARNQEQKKYSNFDQLSDAQQRSIWDDGVARIEASRALQGIDIETQLNNIEEDFLAEQRRINDSFLARMRAAGVSQELEEDVRVTVVRYCTEY